MAKRKPVTPAKDLAPILASAAVKAVEFAAGLPEPGDERRRAAVREFAKILDKAVVLPPILEPFDGPVFELLGYLVVDVVYQLWRHGIPK